jgi:outer membrane protein OmpA-like peptidoglycan-associated protein
VRHDVGALAPDDEDEDVVVSAAAAHLRSDPALRLAIIGHADSTGSASSNRELSMRRARRVRELLVERGIEVTRLDVAARGAEEPVASNATEAGRAQNRRTELFFYYPSRGSAQSQYGSMLVIDDR